jgi:thiamine pyrophosphate-dependent acetolactate synthase large subunit-like protein
VTVRKLRGGSAVVEALRAEGVTHVFGVIGTAMLDVYDALFDCPDITYIGVRHEQNGVHMADGYARVSGRPGVFLAGQPGPGTTNMVSGIAEAQAAFSPVVAIAGSTATSQVDRGTFQEIDQQALFTPITKRTLSVQSAARIPEYVREAFRTAMSGRRGAVVLNVPGDLLSAEAEVDLVPADESKASGAPLPDPALLARAREILLGASRPLILAGAGVKWARAGDDLLALGRRLQSPIAASPGHGDVVPNDDPLFVGQVGPRGNPVATALLKAADVVLAVGTRLGYNSTLFKPENLSEGVQIVQVDIDGTAVGRHFPVAVGLAADAGKTLEGLLSMLADGRDGGRWLATAQADRAALLAARAEMGGQNASPLHPMAIFQAVQDALPRNAIVTVDTGTCSLHATDGMQLYESPGLLTPLDFGLVGFSYAAGLGAKLAAPDRPVLSLIGDGGFGMGMVELGTAVAAGLPTITVVLNNGCWGAEKAYQRDFFDSRFIGADIVNPAFDEVARAYGAVGVRAETAADVRSAVTEGLAADRPTVIDVPVDQQTMTSFRKDSFPHRLSASAGR